MEVSEPVYIKEQEICDDSKRVMQRSKDTNQTFYVDCQGYDIDGTLIFKELQDAESRCDCGSEPEHSGDQEWKDDEDVSSSTAYDAPNEESYYDGRYRKSAYGVPLPIEVYDEYNSEYLSDWYYPSTIPPTDAPSFPNFRNATTKIRYWGYPDDQNPIIWATCHAFSHCSQCHSCKKKIITTNTVSIVEDAFGAYIQSSKARITALYLA